MYIQFLLITAFLGFTATASLHAQIKPEQQNEAGEKLIRYLESNIDSLSDQLSIHYIYPFDCVNCLATMKNRLAEGKKNENTERLQGIILFPESSSKRRVNAVLRYMEVPQYGSWLILQDDTLKDLVETLRPPGIKVSHTVIVDLEKKKIVKSY